MKIYRKNRIINTNTCSNIGIIFLGSQYNTIERPKKIPSETKFNFKKHIINIKSKLKINKTKLYHIDNNYITTIKTKKWNISIIENLIDSHNILDVIDIYKNKLFIINVKYDTKIKDYMETQYLDLFKLVSTSLYNDIYFYNKHNTANCYLNNILSDSENNYNLKIIDLYYHLIGYI